MYLYQPFIYLARFLIGLLFILNTCVTANAATADYQRCKIGQSCTIGEFLYDDDYNPITSASCTLTSRDPEGQVFLNSAAMTANSDGWYSYDVTTTGETEGLYRSQMCCTETTNYLCLDKSFYIGPSFLSTSDVENSVWNATASGHTTTGSFGKNLQNPVLSASEIWGYTNRTLSSFGTLIADIWSYSTRSISSFGTLIVDIWNNDTRTLTSPDLEDGGELSTSETVEQTSYEVAEAAASELVNKNARIAALKLAKSKIIFEVEVSNPSSIIAQLIPFIYYFPPEVKKDHILKIEEALIEDSTNKQVLGTSTTNTATYISGEVYLPPLAKKIYKAEVKDVWQVSKQEINTLRAQAKQLFEPLKKSSFFAQGATLFSDIGAHLDHAWSYQQNALTAEEKIEKYRKAIGEYNQAKAKIESLKVLVAQAGSSKSLLGFIGGIQIASVWGLILVFISGFVFMLLFMKSLKKQNKSTNKKQVGNFLEPSNIKMEIPLFNYFRQHKGKVLTFFLVILSSVLISILLNSNGKNKLAIAQKSIEKIKTTITPTVTNPLPSPTEAILGISKNNKKIFVVVPLDSSVKIHSQPLLESETIYIIEKTATVKKIQELSNWIKIEIPENKESSSSAIVGWIAKEFTQEIPND